MSRVTGNITILPSSRLKDTKMLTNSETGTREFGLWVADPTFSNTDQYTLYTVREVDIGRLDLLSHQFYGTVEYAWIIADANNMRNWWSMKAGDVIRVPTQSVVDAFIRRKGRT